MAEQKLIVIVGATGLQGGSVVNTFLKNPSWKVRALTRSASSAKAKALQDRGAEVVEANLNDAGSLKKAFKGASVVFGVTDFWTIFANPSLSANLKPGQALIDAAAEGEEQQGKNIFDAAATVPTLERLVFSTLAHVKKLSGGRYSKAVHCDSKALAAEYGHLTYPELWSKTSLIQLGYYLTNMKDHPWTAPKKNEETGVYEFGTFTTGWPMGIVAAEEDTGVLVDALVKSPAGKNLAAFREKLSWDGYARLWGKINNVEVSVYPVDIAKVVPAAKDDLEDIFAFAKEYGLAGEKVDKTVISPTQLDPSLRLGSIEEWIKAQDWSSIIKA